MHAMMVRIPNGITQVLVIIGTTTHPPTPTMMELSITLIQILLVVHPVRIEWIIFLLQKVLFMLEIKSI